MVGVTVVATAGEGAERLHDSIRGGPSGAPPHPSPGGRREGKARQALIKRVRRWERGALAGDGGGRAARLAAEVTSDAAMLEGLLRRRWSSDCARFALL